MSAWQNFAVIAGAAAATLTGLMFVVITLIAGIERQAETLDAGISAYNTPTVVHFCAVLLLATLLSAPWQAFAELSLALGLAGLGGTAYMLVVIRRMRRLPGYTPPKHDWLWYSAVPLGAYLVLVAAALALLWAPALALTLAGVVMLALLFDGIRNAWDLVIFLAVERSRPRNNKPD